jgi:hypothetical protein
MSSSTSSWPAARATWQWAKADPLCPSGKDVVERHAQCVDAAGSITFLRKSTLDATKGSKIVMEAQPLTVRQSPLPWT